MQAARRVDRLRCVRRASAKIVFAVGTDAEVRRIAVDARFKAGPNRMPARRVQDRLAPLEQVAVRLHHRAGRRIECLKQSVAKLHRRIRVVRRGKTRRRARNADQRLQNHARRDRPCVRPHHVALVIDVLHAKCGIDCRLIRIRRRPGQVIEIEARKELILRRKLVVDTHRKLVRIRHDLRCRRVRVHAVRSRRQVRHRIARKNRGNRGIHRNCQRVHGLIRKLDGVVNNIAAC